LLGLSSRDRYGRDDGREDDFSGIRGEIERLNRRRDELADRAMLATDVFRGMQMGLLLKQRVYGRSTHLPVVHSNVRGHGQEGLATVTASSCHFVCSNGLKEREEGEVAITIGSRVINHKHKHSPIRAPTSLLQALAQSSVFEIVNSNRAHLCRLSLFDTSLFPLGRRDAGGMTRKACSTTDAWLCK